MKKIIDNVAKKFKLTPDELIGRRRDSLISKARRVAMYIAIQDPKWSYFEIGNMLGGRDAASVINGVRWVARRMDKDPEMKKLVMGLINIGE